MQSVVGYRRRGSLGTLKIVGVVDIFEASTLLKTGQRALEDKQISALHLDLSLVERLDLTSVQILLALKQAAETAAKNLTTDGPPSEVTAALGRYGLTL